MVNETDATLDGTSSGRSVAMACSIPNLMIVRETRAVAVAVVGCSRTVTATASATALLRTAPAPTLRAGAVAALLKMDDSEGIESNQRRSLRIFSA
jgi:hypothetical protein